ncbi:MAG TPA: Dyp-type peroxidase, partial [Dermatophilaceae bacterium]|nr:Dyp-type peroxidase [Dermatophilaceae bacterium]
TGPRAVARAFRGARQAGVVERPQAHAAFVALDLAPGADRDAVARLLTVWTDDIERLVSGRPPLTDVEPELAAVPASLTVTVGVGPRVVEAAEATVPTWLAPLPAFTLDRLEDRWSGGDVLLQVCADSPVTVAHAVRRLVASGAPMVRPRWVQRGFREPFEGSGLPMRNLLGQVDGTVQPEVDGADDALLWVGDGGPAWLRDGSALVLRRIAMDLQRWDAVDRVGRENAIGRRLSDGAPVTAPRGAGPDAPMDLAAVDRIGLPVIDEAAHVRRAHAAAPHERFLRRPYSYDEGDGAAPGGSGLLFAAFCADPVAQFVPVQRRLAEKDLLNLWTTPVGSTVVAVLPGARDGEVLGAAMLG